MLTPWIKPLFLKLSIVNVYHLNDYEIGCYVYRCINKIIPSQFCAVFTVNAAIHLIILVGLIIKLHCEYRRFCVRSNTVRHYVVLLWNSLTDQMIYVLLIHLRCLKIISGPTCL